MRIPYLLSILTLFFISLPSQAQTKAEQILNEFKSLKELTLTLTPDGQVGGLFDFKKWDTHELLWDINDYEVDRHETLRIFILGSKHRPSFSVTYYYSDYLLEGRTTLRRFIGPETEGWRADTIDATTLEDLGFQGSQYPQLTPSQLELIESYNIKLFFD